MLSDKINEILTPLSLKANATVIEQIKYLDELERLGLIEKPVSQTAYKYPVNIIPNRILRYISCRTLEF